MPTLQPTGPEPAAITGAHEIVTRASGRSDVPNSPFTVGLAFMIVSDLVVPGGSVGPNGEIRVRLDLESFGATESTVYVYLGGQIVYDRLFLGPMQFDIVISARNGTQAQRTVRDSSVRETEVNLDMDAHLVVCINKPVATDVVRVVRCMVQVIPNFEVVAESTYQSLTLGTQTVTEADLLLSPLPARVTNDPCKAVRALATAPYAFPPKFFNVCSLTWPVNDPMPLPISTGTTRTMEWAGTGWLEMQTALATSPYASPAGAAPAGISATGLAKLDTLFSAASAQGVDVMLCLTHVVYGLATPAWVSTLGGSAWPMAIPPVGANRTALLDSLKFYVRFLCERYAALHPTVTWYLEPCNEPNTPGVWQGTVEDFVVIVQAIVDQVAVSGAGKVKMVCSSWTDRAGITDENAGSPQRGGLRQTLHEYVNNGGWGQFEILTYHVYKGMAVFANANPSDLHQHFPMFGHDLAILDPLQSAVTQGRFVGLQQMLTNAGLGTTIVPGASCVGGRELWMTECGDGYMATRDRDWFIRLALVASALGVTRYFFYYWGGLVHGGLQSMDMYHAVRSYEAAHEFLAGKTIQWVNASRDLTKVAASIDGEVYRF